MTKMTKWVWLLLLLSGRSAAEPESLRVAVAANFYRPLQQIAEMYQQQSGVRIEISAASTGVLFQQIVHGAPFDLFLAADSKRPQLLFEQGLAEAPFDYARGELAFWCPGCRDINLSLLRAWQGQVAMANPKAAPYGVAAQQVIDYLQWHSETPPAMGSSVAQAYQFIATGSVKGGFVAHSQVVDQPLNAITLPAEWYSPILQQGVILKRSDKQTLAGDFVHYLQDEAQQIVIGLGYLPLELRL